MSPVLSQQSSSVTTTSSSSGRGSFTTARARRAGIRSLLMSSRSPLSANGITLASSLMLAASCFAQGGELSDDVRRLMNGHKWGEARVGVSLVDLKSGVQLASVRAEETFIPASNMKILTSGMALMVLRPEFTFKTQFILDGDTLIIKGDGDPSLADPQVLDKMDPKLTVSQMLATITGAVSKANVTQLSQIIVDDRVFDRELVHPSWPADQLSRGYCAQVSGLNFHANVLHVFPAPGPGGVGTPAAYSLQPNAPWLHIDVRSRTVREGNNSAWITRDDEGNKFTLRGDVRHKSLSPIEVTYHDPATFTGKLLAAELAKINITISPDKVRLAAPGEDVSKGRVLAVVSTPLAEVLKRCNSDSANLYAESLLKRSGQQVTKEPGSWTNGATVLRMTLSEKLGAQAASSTIISDGSGMSRENQVSPTTFTRWLGVIANDSTIADPFLHSLAEVGSGTLRRRFQGVKLKNHLAAKSGYINGVRTLSGYVTNEETGRKVAFSVMINNIRSDGAHQGALELHEEVVQLADKWLTQRIAAERPASGG
jgi:D-alanyl-D-alanine carboxypeptidase/D-alanyl-D-alanine-endopeptidase (penicillin-binding protein 4)